MKTLLRLAFVGLLSSTATAQWVNTPPPQVPRTADGKADLSAPAPRLADGTPDLSGIWQPPTGYLRDLARDLKEPVPFQQAFVDGRRFELTPDVAPTWHGYSTFICLENEKKTGGK